MQHIECNKIMLGNIVYWMQCNDKKWWVHYNDCNVMDAIYWMPCNNCNTMMQRYAMNFTKNEWNAIMHTNECDAIMN